MVGKPDVDMARPISRPQPQHRTPPVRVTNALKIKSPVPQSQYISVRNLAAELGVEDVERLRPLIEHYYLRLLEAREYLPDCLVARPPENAMKWLRGMLQPLAMRPLLSTAQAAELLDTTTEDVRNWCLTLGFQLYDDPAFGELISVRQFHKLYRKIHQIRDRFDRQAMIVAMRKVDTDYQTHNRLLRYSDRLEAEIVRIGKLKEPDRTLRAVAFLEAYQDATNLIHCWTRYKGLTADDNSKIEARLRSLMNRCVGEIPVDDEPEPE